MLPKELPLPNSETGAEPFDLSSWIMKWYEKEIPVEEIPLEHRFEIPIPGGIQILDRRIKGYTFYSGVGKFLVCPNAKLDEDDTRNDL